MGFCSEEKRVPSNQWSGGGQVSASPHVHPSPSPREEQGVGTNQSLCASHPWFLHKWSQVRNQLRMGLCCRKWGHKRGGESRQASEDPGVASSHLSQWPSPCSRSPREQDHGAGWLHSRLCELKPSAPWLRNGASHLLPSSATNQTQSV